MTQNVISITLYLAKSKLYPQIQRKDAINHIYVSYRPVVQVVYIPSDADDNSLQTKAPSPSTESPLYRKI